VRTIPSPRPVARWRVARWGGTFALAGALFLLGIGAAPLIDRDEPAYAEAAREMLSRGDWLVTYFNGRPWFDKPPLVYWGEMVAYRALGVNETAARLPVALFGLAGLAAVYWIGRRLRGPRAGALAAGVLATSLLYLGLARVALLDVPFTACIALAMGALVAGVQEPGRARWPLLAGAALGLAVLAKSVAALVLFAAVLVGVGLAMRSRVRPRGLRWGYALATCAAVAAPWYVAMTLRFGAGFLEQFLGAGHVGRFLQAEHTRSVTPFYYLPILAAGFLPWTAAIPGSLQSAWRDRREAAVPLLWAGLTFAFFTAAQSKLPGYILPMFPALALLVGLDLDRRLEAGALRGMFYATGFTLLVAGVLPVAASGEGRPALWAAGLLGCLAMLPLAPVIWRQGRAAGAAWAAGFGLAAAGLLGYGLLPAVAPEYCARDLARRIQAEGHPHQIYVVGVAPLEAPSLLFYSRQTVTPVERGRAPMLGPGAAVVASGARVPSWLREQGLEQVGTAGRLSLWMAPHAEKRTGALLHEHRSKRVLSRGGRAR